MARVLITAYDVNPFKGSEAATGWNYPYNLAKWHKVTLVTRENNIPEIKRYIKENNINVDSIEFVGFDLPAWARFWKKGVRGSFLYFYLWQLFLSIKFFSKRNEFDLCHSLNFHCDWAPSFLWLLGKPFVWGTINHNEKLPDYVLQSLPASDLRKEKIKHFFKYYFWNFDPFLYICKYKANKILIGHADVQRQLHLNKDKCVLFNQIATNIPAELEKQTNKFNVLFVGRGLIIKNYVAVLDAFKLCIDNKGYSSSEISLTFIGVGNDAKKELVEKAVKLGVEKYLSVHAWIPFTDIQEFYMSASVLCFPSFEGAGMVTAEALSFGVPVITIDKNGAAHELTDDCSFIVDSSNRDNTIRGISSAIISLFEDVKKREAMSVASYEFSKSRLSWYAKSNKICEIYDQLLVKK